jgi:hypothetical protein
VFIQQPCAFYVEAEVSYWGCAYLFWFDKQIPKNVVALTSQCLTLANNMLHGFGLLPAESAGWIPIKQGHSIQVPSYRGMSCEDGNCQSQEMPTQLKQVVSSYMVCLWKAYHICDLADLSRQYGVDTQSSPELMNGVDSDWLRSLSVFMTDHSAVLSEDGVAS